MYFCIRDGVQIKEIYRVPTKTVIPYLKEKSTGGKSIHGHWGTNKDKLINELKRKNVFKWCYYSIDDMEDRIIEMHGRQDSFRFY